jgi:hypothetical protein
MLESELEKLLPSLFEWIDAERKKSFYPKDVSEKFEINEESAKKLIKLAMEEKSGRFKKMLDWRVIVL